MLGPQCKDKMYSRKLNPKRNSNQEVVQQDGKPLLTAAKEIMLKIQMNTTLAISKWRPHSMDIKLCWYLQYNSIYTVILDMFTNLANIFQFRDVHSGSKFCYWPWYCEASGQYLSQCWSRSMSPYCITRPPWVKLYCCYSTIIMLRKKKPRFFYFPTSLDHSFLFDYGAI